MDSYLNFSNNLPAQVKSISSTHCPNRDEFQITFIAATSTCLYLQGCAFRVRLVKVVAFHKQVCCYTPCCFSHIHVGIDAHISIAFTK